MQGRQDDRRPVNTLLVAGFSTRHVVSSARKAGYSVYAIDHFCDRDLREMVLGYEGFEECDELPGLIRTFCEKYQIDAILVTSGAENLNGFPIPVIGTDPAIAERFLDKECTQQFLEDLGVPVPPREKPGVFPVMLKPCRGSGGWRNIRAESKDDITRWKTEFPDEPFLLQHLVPGTPASVCCVSDGRRATALAVNRQILRGDKRAEFGFCGSVTPFETPMADEMMRIAEMVAAASGCTGIVGVDFMVSDSSVYVIEINPRFVATLDTIERATGLNLVRLHIDACRGKIPERIKKPEKTCIRRILFADRDIRVTTDLSRFIPSVADIPVIPASFEEGNAVISVYGEGKDPGSAEEMLKRVIHQCEAIITGGE